MDEIKPELVFQYSLQDNCFWDHLTQFRPRKLGSYRQVSLRESNPVILSTDPDFDVSENYQYLDVIADNLRKNISTYSVRSQMNLDDPAFAEKMRNLMLSRRNVIVTSAQPNHRQIFREQACATVASYIVQKFAKISLASQDKLLNEMMSQTAKDA